MSVFFLLGEALKRQRGHADPHQQSPCSPFAPAKACRRRFLHQADKDRCHAPLQAAINS